MSNQQGKRKLLAIMGNSKLVLCLLFIELLALSYFFLTPNPFLWEICSFLWKYVLYMGNHIDVTVIMAVELFLLAHVTAFLEIYKFIKETSSTDKDPKEKLDAQEFLMDLRPRSSTLPRYAESKPKCRKRRKNRCR